MVVITTYISGRAEKGCQRLTSHNIGAHKAIHKWYQRGHQWSPGVQWFVADYSKFRCGCWQKGFRVHSKQKQSQAYTITNSGATRGHSLIAWPLDGWHQSGQAACMSILLGKEPRIVANEVLPSILVVISGVGIQKKAVLQHFNAEGSPSIKNSALCLHNVAPHFIVLFCIVWHPQLWASCPFCMQGFTYAIHESV